MVMEILEKSCMANKGTDHGPCFNTDGRDPGSLAQTE
jgi:hypothetical protein